jgi:hypothetical protein
LGGPEEIIAARRKNLRPLNSYSTSTECRREDTTVTVSDVREGGRRKSGGG